LERIRGQEHVSNPKLLESYFRQPWFGPARLIACTQILIYGGCSNASREEDRPEEIR
jgi:hypothetical protein